MSRISKSERIQLWLERLKRFNQSKLTAAEFCQRKKHMAAVREVGSDDPHLEIQAFFAVSTQTPRIEIVPESTTHETEIVRR